MIFVADLPADDIGIVAEAIAQLPGNGRAIEPVYGVRVVELAPAAVLGAPAVGIDAQGFGMRRQVSHAGGASVGVPMTTAMWCFSASRMARSSQSRS